MQPSRRRRRVATSSAPPAARAPPPPPSTPPTPRRTPAVVDAISARLIEVATSVPYRVEGFNLDDRESKIFDDPRITDVTAYPAEMWKQPGEKAPNRAALAAWGSWINAFARAEYGRPLVIACSADLADSTNIAGFAKDFGEMPAGAGTSATRTPAAHCCPSRSPSSPTRG